MNEARMRIYDDLKKHLRSFPVEDFVRAYAKAYLEADTETITKLQQLLLGDIPDGSHPEPPPVDPVGAPLKPRPNLNSGAVAFLLPDSSNNYP